MSLSINPLPVVKFIDPVININAKKSYAIKKVAKESTTIIFNAQNVNNQQINITCNPPSPQTIVDPKINVRTAYRMSFTGTAGASGKLLEPNMDGLRAFPFTNSCTAINVNIQNDHYSITPAQYFQALLRYEDVDDTSYSFTPSMVDQYLEYGDFTTYGSAKNALASYGENWNMNGNRGGFTYTVVSDTGTAAVIDVVVCEPLIISPFLWNKGAKIGAGMLGISNMNLSFSFGELSSKLWSHNNTSAGHSTLTSITPVITSCEAIVNFKTLPLDMPIQPAYTYPYSEMVNYQAPYISMTAGSTSQSIMNSVQLKSIPSKIYFFVKEQDADMLFASGGANKTDTFARIQGITINFCNRAGILSTASEQDLFKISIRNGSKQSWAQWSKHVGSVLCITAEDMGLDELQAPSLVGTYQISAILSLKNESGRTINMVSNMLVVNDGLCNYRDGSYSHQIGVISQQDILGVKEEAGISYSDKSVLGSGIFSDVGNWVHKKALPFLKDTKLISKTLKNVPGFEPVGAVAETLGYGSRGKGITGGKLLTRAQLKARLG